MSDDLKVSLLSILEWQRQDQQRQAAKARNRSDHRAGWAAWHDRRAQEFDALAKRLEQAEVKE